MRISDHRLEGVTFRSSPNFSDKIIVPRFIVMHYTASLKDTPSINWLANPDSKVSAHIVIGRKGQITQMVDFNKKAWHAGPSSSQGYSGLNNHAIGIELVNPGPLNVNGDTITDSYGRKTEFSRDDLVVLNGKYWLPYNDKQLDALEEVTVAVRDAYPTIFDCVGHQEIDTRGLKEDPGPMFPMARYDTLVASPHEDHRIYETKSRLNVRTGPSSKKSLSPNGPLDVGTKVKEVSRTGDWVYADVAGINVGYVHANYLRRIR